MPRPQRVVQAVLVVLLSALTACGQSTQFRYRTIARDAQIKPRALPDVPATTADFVRHARRVVIDLGEACRGADDGTEARCRDLERIVQQAIEQTGREVILASRFETEPLALSRERSADLVLFLSPPTHTWTKSSDTPELVLENPEARGVKEAERRCGSHALTALHERKTHALSKLDARWVRSTDGRVLARSHDRMEGEVALPSEQLRITMSRREAQEDGDTDATETRPALLILAHDHDHHHHAGCGHHGRWGKRDRSEDDADDGDGHLLAAILLTLLVVGIFVIAASAASDKETWCAIDPPADVPKENRRALEEQLDRALIERLAALLGPLDPESSAR